MNEKTKYISIDIGGTKILTQVFNENLEVLYENKIKTNNKSEKEFLSQLYEEIDKIYNENIKIIALAFPGIVNRNTFSVIKTPHLPLKNFKAKKLLEKRYKTKIYIDNDVNSFLMAESKRSIYKGKNNLLAIMLGTGFGGAIMIDGNILYGKNGYASEFGHMIVNTNSKLDTLEKNTSGSYISNIAKELKINIKIKAEDLLKDTKESKIIINHILKYLSFGLSDLNLIFNPQAIILGGTMYKLYLSKYNKEISNYIKDNSLDSSSPLISKSCSKSSVNKGVLLSAINYYK